MINTLSISLLYYKTDKQTYLCYRNGKRLHVGERCLRVVTSSFAKINRNKLYGIYCNIYIMIILNHMTFVQYEQSYIGVLCSGP